MNDELNVLAINYDKGSIYETMSSSEIVEFLKTNIELNNFKFKKGKTYKISIKGLECTVTF
jgi:hypothetical protein